MKFLTRHHHGGTYTLHGMHDFEDTWIKTGQIIDKKIEEFQENG